MTDKPPVSNAKAQREAQLAKALRDNLRRRKTGASPASQPKKDES